MATTALSPAQQAEKIEDFFNRAPAFAQPICEKLRAAIAAADPDLKPSWKWSVPVYEKPGPGMVCAIGVFKQHVNFSFMQGALLPDPHGLFTNSQDAKAMRSIKFTEVGQVDEERLVEYLRAASTLKAGAAAKTAERSVIAVPQELKEALAQAGQLEKFEKMAYTHRKEYVRWVTEAKREETRLSRIAKTVERITEGKKFS